MKGLIYLNYLFREEKKINGKEKIMDLSLHLCLQLIQLRNLWGIGFQ